MDACLEQRVESGNLDGRRGKRRDEVRDLRYPRREGGHARQNHPHHRLDVHNADFVVYFRANQCSKQEKCQVSVGRTYWLQITLDVSEHALVFIFK